jgi:hypothetical protein
MIPVDSFAVHISDLIDDSSTEPCSFGSGFKIIKQDGYTILCNEGLRVMYVSQAGFTYLSQKYAAPREESEAFQTSILSKMKER